MCTYSPSPCNTVSKVQSVKCRVSAERITLALCVIVNTLLSLDVVALPRLV